MTTTQPPELPEMAQPSVKPIWTWALLLAGGHAVLAFLLADQGKETPYRLGYAMGNAGLPLLGAWFGYHIYKRPHTPTVVTGVLVALALSSTGKTLGAIHRVTTEYTADFEKNIEAWTKHCGAWEASGGCELTIIRDHDNLRRNLALALEVKEACEPLLAELEGGGDYLERLAAEGIKDTDANAAWSRYQQQDEFDTVLATVKATDELFRTVTIHLAEMDDKFGKWQVGEDNMILFDEDVDDKIIERVSQQLETMHTQATSLVEMSERNQKRLNTEAR